MLGDKNKQGGNNSSMILLLVLMGIFFSTSILFRDDAEQEITKQQMKEIAISDSLKKDTTASSKIVLTVMDSSAELEAKKREFVIFAESQMINKEKDVTVNTPLAKYTFSTKGGNLKQVKLHNYKTYQKTDLEFFLNEKNTINYIFSKTGKRYETATMNFAVSDYQMELDGNDNTSIIFTLKGIGGEEVRQTYTISANSYYLDYNVEFSKFTGLSPEINAKWESKFSRKEKGIENERNYAEMVWREMESESTDDIGENRQVDDEDPLKEKIDWLAHKQQFFTSALIAPAGMKANGFKMFSDDEDTTLLMSMTSNLQFTGSESGALMDMQMYQGPNEYDDLTSADIGLEEVIPYTWAIFGFFNKYITHNLLSLFGKLTDNYGLIIILISLSIKLMISPFTYKTYLSSLKMKALKPDLEALKEKYKDDQQTYQMEQMKFYRQAGVNPLGGCVPLLFQMPILFAMFRFFPSAIELRGKSFLHADDLSSYDAFITWSSDFSIPFIGDHLSLFTVLMSITTIITARLSSTQMPQQDNNPMAGQMKVMQWLMPVIFLPLFNNYAAALSFYYFVMNCFTILQNFLMKQLLIDEDKIRAKIQLKKSQPVKESRFQRKLKEMMEQQQQMKKQR